MPHLNVISHELLQKVTIHADSLQSVAGGEMLAEVMEEFGFAVVSGVLGEDQIAEAERLFDEDLFSIVDLPEAEKKKQTCFQLTKSGKSYAKRWPSSEFPLGREIPAFASDYGIPQGRCAWYCRLNPQVRKVFEVLHDGCKDLCVGMDNLFFDNSREDHTTPDEERENHIWPHADQSTHAHNGHLNCYQSILYLWPSNQYNSTTVVWPCSHKEMHATMMNERAYANHFCRLPPKYHQQYVEGAVRVTIPAGGMIVWNSKLIHQGWNYGPRLAIPICMEPKDRRDEGALTRKILAVERGVPTTHWASLGLIHGVVTERPGGSKNFPLSTHANEWIIQNGVIDPKVEELL